MHHVPLSGPELDQLKKPQVDYRLIDPKCLDFSKSASYVNRTERFVLPIPALENGGEPLVYPEGTENAGQAIKALEDGTPERGVVFRNGEDSVWQVVRGNGKEALLITGVNAENAALLTAKLDEIKAGKTELNIEDIREFLAYGRDELGLIDRQNKKLEAVPQEMKPIEGSCPNHFIVTKATHHKAVLIEEPIIVDGPVKQTYAEGAVLLSDGKFVWGIGKNVFLHNFKRVDGDREINLVSLDEEFKDK